MFHVDGLTQWGVLFLAPGDDNQRIVDERPLQPQRLQGSRAGPARHGTQNVVLCASPVEKVGKKSSDLLNGDFCRITSPTVEAQAAR